MKKSKNNSPQYLFPMVLANGIANYINGLSIVSTPCQAVYYSDCKTDETTFVCQPLSSQFTNETRDVKREDYAFLLVYQSPQNNADLFILDYLKQHFDFKTLTIDNESVVITGFELTSDVNVSDSTATDGFIDSTLLENENIQQSAAIVTISRYTKR